VFDNYQSAYRNHHSTETALIKVVNDIASEMDEGKVILLVALDVSAAFDTVQHEILLKRLVEAGIQESALEWMKSYLENRSQAVCFKGQKSNSRSIKYGVPQGSVLGPLLFNLYMAPIRPCIHKIYNYKYRVT
jgi:retron-type reverse transcriptase